MSHHQRPRGESGLAGNRLAVVVVFTVGLAAMPVVGGLVGGWEAALIGAGFAITAAVAAASAAAVLVLLRRRLARAEAHDRRRNDQLRKELAALEIRLAKQDRRLKRLVARTPGPRAARRERNRLYKQVQDLLTLYSMVPVRAGIPTLGSWTASADLLIELLDRFVEERPAVVVEGGSGVSTLVLALAAREHKITTRIVALEHDPDWAESTRRLLDRHGVADHAEVRIAPLAPCSIENHETPWYDESALADLTDVGLVLVDGPPGVIGQGARYPMVPLLLDRLAHRCTILVDDTDRPSDRDVLERWRPFLPDFTFETLPLDKGAARLARK